MVIWAQSVGASCCASFGEASRVTEIRLGRRPGTALAVREAPALPGPLTIRSLRVLVARRKFVRAKVGTSHGVFRLPPPMVNRVLTTPHLW